jgi:DNA processing protein
MVEKGMEERDYFLGFSVFSGIGPKRLQQLLKTFGSAKNAWEGDESVLRETVGNFVAEGFVRYRREFSIDTYKKRLEEKTVQFISLIDTSYPIRLKKVPFPPFVLYGRGDVSVLTMKSPAIGVVGTRKITAYGREVTETITRDLACGGCIIVSGLALGVDAVSHRVTMDVKGKTIAVLGSGVDICHPSSNRSIYDAIIAGGGIVISEYPLGEPPSRGSFPSRNRIIAGLSDGVVVTEGAQDSGSLITAEDAFSFERNVYAVPGPITSSLSKGPNSLLVKGAKLVTSGDDILHDLGIKGDKRDRGDNKIKGETEEEQRIIDLLMNEALLFDEIVKKTGFDSSKTGILLSVMELKGFIKIGDAGSYQLHLSP